MAINFISSKDSDKTHTKDRKSHNIEIMMGNEIDEIIEELFESLLQKYQERLEESMKGSEFVFDSVDLLYYKVHKISLNRGRSYIDSPKWLKNKKATIYKKKNDDKCFQYSITSALSYEQIKSHPERISKFMTFIDQYNWKEITIALNILYVSHKTEETRHVYKLKYDLNRENQVILLIITDGKKWHYLAVKG